MKHQRPRQIKPFGDRAAFQSLLSEWCLRAGSDPAVAEIVRRSGVQASANIQVQKPNLAITFRAGRNGLRITCSAEKRCKSALRMDSGVFHRVMCGAQNLMIGLNKRELGTSLPDGFPGDMLRLLLDMQPALSKIYRTLLDERGLTQ